MKNDWVPMANKLLLKKMAFRALIYFCVPYSNLIFFFFVIAFCSLSVLFSVCNLCYSLLPMAVDSSCLDVSCSLENIIFNSCIAESWTFQNLKKRLHTPVIKLIWTVKFSYKLCFFFSRKFLRLKRAEKSKRMILCSTYNPRILF